MLDFLRLFDSLKGVFFKCELFFFSEICFGCCAWKINEAVVVY